MKEEGGKKIISIGGLIFLSTIFYVIYILSNVSDRENTSDRALKIALMTCKSEKECENRVHRQHSACFTSTYSIDLTPSRGGNNSGFSRSERDNSVLGFPYMECVNPDFDESSLDIVNSESDKNIFILVTSLKYKI